MNAQTKQSIDDTPEVLTDVAMLLPAEAARLMRVSVSMFREIVKSGGIRFIPWGNEKRVPMHELRRWQEEMLRTSENNEKIVSIDKYFTPKEHYRGKRK
ncbi:MAG: helix-turn-helix domain-containing protein [Candidatus Magasanikiibacteriota bacterium]